MKSECKPISAGELDFLFLLVEELEKRKAHIETNDEVFAALWEHCTNDPQGRLAKAIRAWGRATLAVENDIIVIREQIKTLPEHIREHLEKCIGKVEAESKHRTNNNLSVLTVRVLATTA